LTALQAQDANLTALVSINGGQIAGLRNRVINGRIAVDQRNAGASQTITGGTGYTGSAYTVDRWAAFSVGSTGATFTAQRTGAAPYSLSLSVTAINFGTILGVYQRIEAINCTDLANQSVTISASISCDSSQTITWIAYYPNTKDTWTGPGVSSGPSTGATQIATGTWSATTTPTRFSATFTNASSLNGLQIVIQRSISANAQTLVVTDVQLERGSVATIFEQRPIGLELALCQRYFWFTGGTSFIATGYMSALQVGLFLFASPVAMRLGGAVASLVGTPQIYTSGVQANVNAIGSNYSNAAGSLALQLTSLTNFTVGAPALVFGNGGGISFSAEL